MTSLFLLAQTETIFVDVLKNYGPVGLILIAVATGVLYTRQHVEDLRKQIVELREELREARADIRRANEVSQEVLLPVATRTLEAINAFNDELAWRRRGTAS